MSEKEPQNNPESAGNVKDLAEKLKQAWAGEVKPDTVNEPPRQEKPPKRPTRKLEKIQKPKYILQETPSRGNVGVDNVNKNARDYSNLNKQERAAMLGYIEETLKKPEMGQYKEFDDLSKDENLIQAYNFFRSLDSLKSLMPEEAASDSATSFQESSSLPEPSRKTKVNKIHNTAGNYDKAYMASLSEDEKAKRIVDYRDASDSEIDDKYKLALMTDEVGSALKNELDLDAKEVSSLVDKKTGTIRVIPAGPVELRERMKKALVEKPENGWDTVNDSELQIQKDFGLENIVRGGKSPEDSLRILNNVREGLIGLDPAVVKGLALAIDSRVKKRRDGIINIPADSTPEDVKRILTQAAKSKPRTKQPNNASGNSVADKIYNDKVNRDVYNQQLDDEVREFNKPDQAVVNNEAVPPSTSVFKNTFKQPAVTYNELGQADLPGLHSQETLQRAGILAPEQEQSAAQTVEKEQEPGDLLKQIDLVDLSEARTKYVKAKRALDEFSALSHLRNKMKLGGESKVRVTEALEQARQDYESARLEYIGANLELHLQEQTEMRKARFEEYVTMNAGAMDKARGLWNKLGNVNYFEYRKNQGKEIQNRVGATLAKAANIRTAISLGLLGTGLYAGATAAGAGILLARRSYGGFGSAMGSKSLFEQIRMAKNNRPISADQFSNLHTVEEVQNQMAALEARAMLSGQNEEKLLENSDYQALLRIQDYLLTERVQYDASKASESLQGSFKSSEEAITQAQKAEKRGRAKTTAAALAAGVVGAGGVAKAVEYWNGEQPEVSVKTGSGDRHLSPEKSADLGKPEGIELTHYGKGTGATIEVEGNNTFVTAGNRGIEGALQDLKRQDPEKYKGMINWIKEQYPGTQAKDSTLIHRAVKKLAEQNNFTVDGGGKDLSRVDFAKVVLKPTADGQFELQLDKPSLDFMDDNGNNAGVSEPDQVVIESQPDKLPIDTLRAVPDDAPIDTLRRVGETAAENKIGPEEVEVEKLDFKNLIPESENSNSIYNIAGEAAESRTNNTYELALSQVDQYPKTSDALKHLLKDDYTAFMKEKIQLDARVINRLQKFPVSQFMQEYAHSKEIPPKQLMELRGLADSINDLLVRSSDSERTAIRSGTIRQLLIRLASERLNK